ncbi:hypothetical protein PG988_013939 [Apiospora saccharicola]
MTSPHVHFASYYAGPQLSSLPEPRSGAFRPTIKVDGLVQVLASNVPPLTQLRCPITNIGRFGFSAIYMRFSRSICGLSLAGAATATAADATKPSIILIMSDNQDRRL